MKYLAIFLLLVLALPVAFGAQSSASSLSWPAPTDFGSNFDNFPSGTVSPFPWTYTQGASTGVTAGTTNSQSRSSPYSYELSTSTITASPGPKIQAVFNATESVINVTVYMDLTSSINTETTYGYVSVSTPAQSKQTSFSCNAATCLSTGWLKESVQLAAIPAQSVTVTLNFSVSGSNNLGQAYFDDFSIIGAAAYTSSQGGPAINLQLYNDSSAGPYWFDPSGYTGSYVQTQWTSASNNSNQWVHAPTSGLSVAGMNISNAAAGLTLNSANLVTVYLGGTGGYSRSLIPAKTGVTNMYLDNPLSVSSYNFQFNSPNGQLVDGDLIYLTLGGRTITSGYLDSSFAFPTYLTPGLYNIQLLNGSNTAQTIYTGSIAVSPQSSTSQTLYSITVSNMSSSFQNTAQQSVSIGESLSGTTLDVSFKDSTSTTSWVNATLSLKGINGNTVQGFNCISTYTKTGCTTQSTIGTATSSFAGIILNETTLLYVTFTFNQSGTLHTIGPYQVQGGSVFGNVQGPQNNCIFGFACTQLTNSFNSSSSVMLDILSIAIVLAVAEGFDGKHANFGVLVLALVTGTLLSAGWINLTALTMPAAAIAILAILAVLQLAQEKEKGAESLFVNAE